MAAHGFPDAVVEAIDPEFQKQVWDVRKSGLNIMMSMKGDGKPVSCIEDCAVELTDLAELHQPPQRTFREVRHHGNMVRACLGGLPTRPPCAEPQAGNGREETEGDHGRNLCDCARIQRARIPENTGTASCAPSSTRSCTASGSSRHSRKSSASSTPSDLLNPGKIVQPSKMDDRRLFPLQPGLPAVEPVQLDWTGRSGGALTVRWRCATTTAPAASSTRR